MFVKGSENMNVRHVKIRMRIMSVGTENGITCKECVSVEKSNPLIFRMDFSDL